jgi:hypothetical protein
VAKPCSVAARVRAVVCCIAAPKGGVSGLLDVAEQLDVRTVSSKLC